MPVEIRELVIRAVTIPERKDAKHTDTKNSRMAQRPRDNTEMIVQECVRQVLRILQKEKER